MATGEIELTHPLIEAGQSGAGGWTKRQLALLGVAWPPAHGWKAGLVGARVSAAVYANFLAARKQRPVPNNEPRGLHAKYTVTRADGADAPGGRHDGCRLFVLDLTHDPHAREAARAYARSCRERCPELAADLERQAHALAVEVPCPTCDGTGEVHSHNPLCWECKGRKRVLR